MFRRYCTIVQCLSITHSVERVGFARQYGIDVRLATLLFRHALQHDHTQAGKFFCDGRHLAAQIIDPRHIGGKWRVVGHDTRRLHRRLDARAARDRFTTGNR
jgi:hypothetical protein